MRFRLPLLLLLPLLLTCCKDGEGDAARGMTPQEMYEKGRALLKPNIEQNASDFEQALAWTRRAAEGGWRQAQTDLGGLYMYGGKGVTIDGAKAREWFNRAAAQGSMEAEYFLGELYRRGLGVKADMEEAKKHWRRAAEGGIAEAQQRLGHQQVLYPESFSEGLEWLQRAATQGRARGKADAACDLGTIYANGIGGVAPDMQEAAKWFAIGAEGGNAQAQHIYGIMLLEGNPVEKDEEAGMFMLRRAASQEHLPAMAEFIRRLRNTPNASEEQKKEAEAWNERLNQLMVERRAKATTTPQPQPNSAQ